MIDGRFVSVAVILLATPVRAATAGPQLPPAVKATPAQQAIALAHRDNDPPPPARPCRQQRGQDEIMVCGQPGDRSPYRLPLPAERPARAHPGEFHHVDIGTGPVPVVPGTTVARFGMSRAARERNATLKVIDELARAKAEAAEPAKRVEIVHPADGTIRVKPDDSLER